MQVNVLGAERRRRWSYDEKVRLVEETLQPGETICGVARLASTNAPRRLGRDAAPALVPVEITPVAAPISSGAPQLASSPPAQLARAGIIEIELGGSCRVRVDRDVDVGLGGGSFKHTELDGDSIAASNWIRFSVHAGARTDRPAQAIC